MRRWVRAAAGVALAGGLVVSAHADVSSSVQASLVSYRLIDLDVTDGVAPSISWLPDLVMARAVRGSNVAWGVDADGNYMSGPYGAGFSDYTDYPTTTTGVVSGSVRTSSAQASTSWVGASGYGVAALGQTSGYDARGLDPAGTSSFNASFYAADAQLKVGFTLSAHTAVVFSFAGEVWTMDAEGGYSRGSGGVDLLVHLGDTDSLWRSGQLEQPGSFTTKLGAYNVSGTAQDGRINLTAQAMGNLYAAAPVPEMQTWGLALAGVAVVMGARRRQAARVAQEGAR